MTSSSVRRPLPALAFLVALSFLTGIVWWRVIERDDPTASASIPCSTPSATASALPRPASVTVTVLNTTQRSGLAAGVAAQLRQDGFTVVRIDNDDTAKLNGIGQIQFSPGDSSAAATVAYYLPGTGAPIPLDTANDAAVTILLGPGYASLASAAAVQTAMASAHATFVLSSPPSPTTSESRSLTPSLSVKPSC